MTLPKVLVHAAAGEPPLVVVDGAPLDSVRSAQVTVTSDGVPQVSLVLAASEVEVELPAGVTVLRAGATAAEFVASLRGAALEQAALEHIDDDLSQGDAFLAALAAAARTFDDRG